MAALDHILSPAILLPPLLCGNRGVRGVFLQARGFEFCLLRGDLKVNGIYPRSRSCSHFVLQLLALAGESHGIVRAIEADLLAYRGDEVVAVVAALRYVTDRRDRPILCVALFKCARPDHKLLCILLRDLAFFEGEDLRLGHSVATVEDRVRCNARQLRILGRQVS